MKSKIRTVTCPDCGCKHSAGFASARTMRRPLQFSPRAEAALLIPAGQAIGTAAIIAAGGTLAADLWMPGWESWKVGALCGVVALGGVWWDGIRDDAKRVWYELERRFGVDLDGDGIVGEPEPQPIPPPRPMIKTPTTQHKAEWIEYSIPFTDWDEAHKVAREILVYKTPFSRGRLVTRGALPDDPKHYTAIYGAMIKNGILEKDKGKNVVTDIGRAFFTACMQPPPDADREHNPPAGYAVNRW